ncbi:hypothetical protein BLS_003847 [Venturia inaequalis]|uniref:PNPLA domain-containing protein n=1 Tax=Venturia inaequalis TaxID=5025 RepID=A0A8H3V9A5_VENIN|nr:hypothetical protein BLS_003847 [Venturia inaequalis]
MYITTTLRKSRDFRCITSFSSLFCDECWNQQFVHKKAKLGPGSIPHERTRPKVAEKVRNALAPPANDRVLAQMCRDDELTSWFGIERLSENGPPIFQDYGRFSDLMSTTDPVRRRDRDPSRVGGSQRTRDTRTPSLVSFVGQTGAGKSTLIKLLIDLASDDNALLPSSQINDLFPTPVVGATGGHLPTSEDVHLYLDPRTAHSMSPVLFADCEGLEGGEREPTGAKLRKKRKHEEGRLAGAIKAISEQEITWADSPRTRTREFAVTNLYPRLLYTFSDVIVFVLKNPRVVEHVFERLVDWAAAAIETSSNQPVLPHAIIVLNASENEIHPSLWDVYANTGTILDDLAGTVNQNETFKKYAEFWRSRGRTIDSLEQLVAAYYSSIQRVPADGRPKLMHDQVGKLYSGLMTASVAARSNKASLRMLLDVEGLQSYLTYAFTHFSGTLEFPFDFVQASFINSPIPANFGGNILKLALNIMDVWGRNTTPSTIFESLSFMIASCIMFESARNAEQIFSKYLEHIDAALENFLDQHWPCEFVIQGTDFQCVNVRNGHGSKGHQLKNGTVFAAGEYISEITFAEYSSTFRNNVYETLDGCLEDLRRRLQCIASFSGPVANNPVSAIDVQATEIHCDALHDFYDDLKYGSSISEHFSSHTACYACLLEPPEHTLPCGHVLCTPGGMRGIVELETLRHIEDAMEINLPIHCFFDLIVGTSTGGLIALGLGSMGWSVEECTERFQSMCKTAFTRRLGVAIPGIGLLVENFNHSRYATKPLEQTLKAAFTENEYLFGGPKRSTSSRIKVAVTATSLTGRNAIVFGNYNRLCSGKLQYHFQRSERKLSEMKVWEAARATSAAPRYFKPFYHQATQKNLIDGAIWHNNPIVIAEQERKLIWPELEDKFPDIILSLGTATSHRLRRAESSRAPAQRGIISHASDLVNLVRNHMATSIECDRIWDGYIDQLPKFVKASRFVRINPELPDEVPALDDVEKMTSLREAAEDWLRNQSKVKKVALQLIASCFYFEVLGSIINGKDEAYVAEGRICCRFAEGTSEIQELGRCLGPKTGKLKFMVREAVIGSRNDQYILFPQDTVRGMILDRLFQMPIITIKISEKLSITDFNLVMDEDHIFPISGFPRSIFGDESRPSTSQRSVSSDPNRWAGLTSQRKKVRKEWKPPSTETGQRRAKKGTIYAAPMQSQRTVSAQGFKAQERRPQKRAQIVNGDGRPLPSPKSFQSFRLAFRALSRPVKQRSLPPYEEWLSSLEPGSNDSLETYYSLFTPNDNLRTLYNIGERRDASSPNSSPKIDESTTGDEDAYQVDVGEGLVYHRWLSGLQMPGVKSPRPIIQSPNFEGGATLY